MRSAALLAVLLAGCLSKLEPLYCEGGVVGGKADGGDCLSISAEKVGDDPTSIGSAVLMSKFQQRYSLRRVAANKFDLFLAGAAAGTIERDGSWITVTFYDPPKKLRLRSDAPGFLR